MNNFDKEYYRLLVESERLDEGAIEYMREKLLKYVSDLGHRIKTRVEELCHAGIDPVPQISLKEIVDDIEAGDITSPEDAFKRWVQLTHDKFHYEMKSPEFFHELFINIEDNNQLEREFEQWRVDWLSIFKNFIVNAHKHLVKHYPELYPT